MHGLCDEHRRRQLGATSPVQSQLLIYVTVQTQVNEMQLVREKVYAMEQTHMALKQK